MRPPTHDDPNAIPREGTEVPWVELPDPSAGGPGTRGARRAPEVGEDLRDGRNSAGAAAQRGT